jgi:hypothetical protein
MTFVLLINPIEDKKITAEVSAIIYGLLMKIMKPKAI